MFVARGLLHGLGNEEPPESASGGDLSMNASGYRDTIDVYLHADFTAQKRAVGVRPGCR